MTRQCLFASVAMLALASFSASAAELSAANQAKLIGNVDAYAARMSEVALQIWAMPELGYQETKTTALLQSELKRAGFRIDTGVAEIPTAFVARAGTNDGPVIAILAEMDGDAVRAAEQGEHRGSDRVRLDGAPGLAHGGNVVDVDAESNHSGGITDNRLP